MIVHNFCTDYCYMDCRATEAEGVDPVAGGRAGVKELDPGPAEQEHRPAGADLKR